MLNLCVIGSPTCSVIPPGLAGQNPQQLLPATQQLIASEAALNEAAIVASVQRPLVAGVVNECHAVGSLETLTPDCLDLILPNISNRDY